MKQNESTANQWNKYWKRRTKKNKTFIHLLHHFLLRKIVDRHFIKFAMDNSAKGKIIEVGSGIGLDSILISKKRGDDVILLDFSTKALEDAEKLSKEHDIKIKTVNADIRKKLPFNDKEATLSWNVGTIEHFEDPVSIVKEMGRIADSVVCIVPMRTSKRLFYEKIRTLFNLGGDGLFILYTENELRDIFKDAGLKKISSKKFSFFFGFITFCGVSGKS